MKENFEIEFDNLTEEDKEKFLEIVEKAKIPIKKRWKGKEYDTYYAITSDGSLVDHIEEKSTYDNDCYIMGNYFQTKEDAEFAMKKQIIYQQLKDYVLAHNTEEIDWENDYLSKFCIAYDYYDKQLFVADMKTIKYSNTIYFTSRTIAENAIKEIGEDKIKYYLFGIED